MRNHTFGRTAAMALASLHRFLARAPHAVPVAVLTGLGLLAGWDVSRAGVVIFKDGFTIEGTIKQETTHIYEPGVYVTVPKLGGFIKVDDGARVIAFSYKQVEDAGKKEAGRDTDPLRLERGMVRLDHFRLPPGQITALGHWDAKWDRVLSYDSPAMGHIKIPQHLTLLTPHFVRIDARRYNWSPFYLTREFDPETVRKLLLDHPQLKMKGDASDAPKRFRIFQFFLRAGWYDRAAAELDGILRDFPDQKDKVANLRDELQKILAAELVDLIERAHRAGRQQWVQAKLAAFPQQGAEEKQLSRLRALQAEYETANQNLALARRFLARLLPRVFDSNLRHLFGEAVPVLTAELNLDTVNRLEPFLSLAQQAQRELAQKRPPTNSPEQLLSLAVTGWVLGSAAAETKPETAQRLWRARQFVLDYQRTHNAADRQQLLTSYQERVGIAFDELAQLLRLLPPAEPFELAAAGSGLGAAAGLPFAEGSLFWALLAIQKLLPAAPLELRADLPWSYRQGPSYWLQLPPEYHLGRDYPVLFVLHQGGETPEEMLQRWSSLAAEHGYLLVAPEWQRGSESFYRYSSDEQRAVVDVLRDLRRRFQIDSDRVFLAGYGEGANMAFDVGLAHPDLLAGVVPIGGRPRYYARDCWHNAQYLPFYVVEGDAASDDAKANRSQFEHWIGRGYPALDILYKGRGVEWFPAELPYIFDWMGRKKRAAAFPQLGTGGFGGVFSDEFQTQRHTATRFYWLAGEELNENNTNEGSRWNNRVLPATLQASIGARNQINVNAHGFRGVTIWLGPGMIDFEKPVSVYVNSHQANYKVRPSLATLLEDFYVRGDRQRLFYAQLKLRL